MESCTSVEVLNPNDTIKLYKYRWVIITIFAFYSAVNFSQFMQLTIIADILKKYYGVGELLVDMTGMSFMIAFIVLFVPVGYIVENTSLKTTSIISTGLTFVGNFIKIYATVPGTFYLLLISQTIISICQIFMFIIPSKVASSWFGANEVSTACAIGLFGTQIGIAVGAFASTIWVKNDEDFKVEEGLNQMFIYYAIISGAVFVIVILFFRSKPPLPPSPSQASLKNSEKTEKVTFWLAMKGFARNKDFLVVLLSFGINYGLWNTFSIILNQLYTNSFPDESDDTVLGILTFATVASGGCFGSVLFGYILDKTHKFKLVSFSVQLATLLAIIAEAITLITNNKIGTFIAVPIFGFFSGSLLVISYEYTIETTYPTPEAFGASVLNFVVYVFGIIFTLILDYVFDAFGYTTGWIIMIIFTAIGTFSILLVSPELKRRDANLQSKDFEEKTGFDKYKMNAS